MRSFIFSTLRSRWVSFVGIVIAACTAVALMTACGMLLESGIRGGVAPERLAGVPIVVAGRQAVSEVHGSGENAETITTGLTERRRLDSSLLERINALPGVGSTHAEVNFSAHLLDVAGSPIGSVSWGHGWSSAESTSFAMSAGRAPSGPGEIAIDDRLASQRGVHPGDAVAIAASGRRLDATVVGIVHHDIEPLLNQSAIFFADTEATTLYGNAGEIDLITIAPSDGTDVAELKATLGDALGADVSVLTGDDRGRAEFIGDVDASTRLIAISGSLGGIAAVVAIMAVSGMLALIVQQRHREIALLRAIAATPRQVRRMMQLETLLVMSIGSIIGFAPGIVLAGRIEDLWRDRGVLPLTFRSEHGVFPVFCAIMLTLLVGSAAAFFAGRRASRVRPIEALAESSIPATRLSVGRWILGLVSAGGAAALFVVALHVDGFIAAALVPALLVVFMLVAGIFAPLLTAIGVRVVGVLALPFGVSGHLAGVNTKAFAKRLTSAVVPVVLALAVAGMAVFQQATVSSEGRRQGSDRVVATHVIAGGDVGLPVSLVATIAGQQGADAVVGLQETQVHAGSDLDAQAAIGITGGLDRLVDLDVTTGSLSSLVPGEVAMSTDMASDLGAHVGEPVRMRLGDGAEISPRLTAIFDRSIGFAQVVLPWDTIADHVTEQRLDTVLVSGRKGSDLGANLQRLTDTVPGARLGDGDLIREAEDASADTNTWVTLILMGLVTAFAGIAVINTLALSTADRVREFAMLRLVGTTRRQVLRMVRIEALIVIVLGCLLGAAVTLGTLIPFTKATTGSAMPSTPALYCLALFVGTALLCLFGTVVPARVALRLRPVDSIGARQ